MHNSPDEWYSPILLVECARQAMGSITLDPFSSHAANAYVRADQYYTAADDGLAQEWTGNVYLNPPFSLRKTEVIIFKALKHFRSSQIENLFLVLPHHYEAEMLTGLRDYAAVYSRLKNPIRFLNPQNQTYNEKIDIYYFGARQRQAQNAINALKNLS